MPVVDASVLVEYLSKGEDWGDARVGLAQADSAWWAPHLVDAEVGHVLRRRVAAGEIGAVRARAALDDLSDLTLIRTAHIGLLERAWSLRSTVSFYDGLYVALAELLKMPLLTLDTRLAKASGVQAQIDVIG